MAVIPSVAHPAGLGKGDKYCRQRAMAEPNRTDAPGVQCTTAQARTEKQGFVPLHATMLSLAML